MAGSIDNTGAAAEPLSDRERKLLERLLSNPIFFPQKYTTWVLDHVKVNISGILTSQITGANPVPTGAIIQWGGLHNTATVPAGYLACDGSTKKRSIYVDLFNLIGTSYNTGGEAVDEFRLPNITDSMIKT